VQPITGLPPNFIAGSGPLGAYCSQDNERYSGFFYCAIFAGKAGSSADDIQAKFLQ
jgi:hypothetical protein